MFYNLAAFKYFTGVSRLLLCSTRKTFRYGCDGLDWIKPSQSTGGMAVV